MTLKVEKLSKWCSLVLLLLLSSLCADNTILDGASTSPNQWMKFRKKASWREGSEAQRRTLAKKPRLARSVVQKNGEQI